MPYHYLIQRDHLFTEAGQVMFLKIRDNVHRLTRLAGAVRMQEAIAGTCGDSWDMLACVDRLVELNELREIVQPACAGQYRVFVSRRDED